MPWIPTPRADRIHTYMGNLEKTIEHVADFWTGRWFGTFLFFSIHYTLGISSSQLTFICFRGIGIPPTSDLPMPGAAPLAQWKLAMFAKMGQRWSGTIAIPNAAGSFS